MRYTKYLSQMVSTIGVPNMEEKHFRIIMNIVHLEGDLNRLNKLKVKITEQAQRYKYDRTYMTQSMKLTEITKNLPPQEFFNKMLSNQGY